jgi:hypothetical protein
MPIYLNHSMEGAREMRYENALIVMRAATP